MKVISRFLLKKKEPNGATRSADKQSMIPRIMRLFKPYGRRVAIIGALILVTASLGVANPILIKVVFDSALFPAAGGGPDLNLLWIIVGFMAVIAVASGALGIVQTYLTNKVDSLVTRPV